MLEEIIRKMPRFKGKNRMARLLFKKEISQSSNLKVKGKYNCQYNLPNIKESVAFEIFVNGIYESDTNQFLYERVPENGLLIDIGANIGAVTIPLCKRRKDIRVLCIEAAPSIFATLEKNIKENGLDNQVSCYNYALYDVDHKILPFYSSEANFGKGSLSAVYTDKAVEVRTIRLDTLINELGITKVDFIKIDIEGYEYYAFKGAEELLNGYQPPTIFFEFADWAETLANGLPKGSSQDILLKWGYDLFTFEEEKLFPIQAALRSGSKMMFATKNSSDPMIRSIH
jgi:FkbM family methyltransferase